MIVLSSVPAKDSGGMQVRLDDDAAPASRLLAWPRPDPFWVFLDVFAFATGSLTRTNVNLPLVPK